MSKPPVDAEALLAQARAWAAEDPGSSTRAELEALISTRDLPALAERFEHPLAFGTAGLRGRLGAGPGRMNRAVVIRTSAGLASYLASRGARTAVIGRDARHCSDELARDAAEVLAGAGLRVSVLPDVVPTPLLSFAVLRLGAGAGVMITASHNPAGDNGYKVYLGDGRQILPPAASEIAGLARSSGAASAVRRSAGVSYLDDDVVDAYVSRLATLLLPGSPRGAGIAYTPLHGVAGKLAARGMQVGGFAGMETVVEQFAPDPGFPTIASPNPEERETMRLVTELAERSGLDVALANDPDGDRLGVAVGGRLLTGDQTGVLLASHLLETRARPVGGFATSIVSSSLLAKMAASAGVAFTETLTGFKWLSRVPGLAYAYEEALGYCVDPAAVADKDGISAALLVAELASIEKARGRTITDRLDDIETTFGVHVTSQLTVALQGAGAGEQIMARLRRAPPGAIGGLPVSSADDLALPGGGLPASDVLRYFLSPRRGPGLSPRRGPGAAAGLRPRGGRVVGARVAVRPSGTEPKLKCYLEVVAGATGTLPAGRAAASETMETLREAMSVLLGEQAL